MNWANKKATINMECSDEESFRWAVARALNPIIKSPGRVTKVLRAQSKLLNWGGLDFPTPIEQIKRFEKSNNLLVNVLGFEKGGDARLLRVPTGVCGSRVLLLLVDDRYVVVNNISRLLHKQAAAGRGHRKRFYCCNCLEVFLNRGEFDKHMSSLCEAVGGPTIDGCDLCDKRGESLCPLHMDLDRLDAVGLFCTKGMRDRIFDPKRVQSFVLGHDDDRYEAVLKSGVWVFSYLGKKEKPVARRVCIACWSGFCLRHMVDSDSD